MTYAELKAVVDSKGLALQFLEFPNRYELFVHDGFTRYDAFVYRRNTTGNYEVQGIDLIAEDANRSDFELNRKAGANKFAGIQLQGFKKFHTKMWRKSFKYSAATGSTSQFSEKFTKALYLWGGSYWVGPEAVLSSDYIEFEVADLDNVLGYGPGAVLARYVETEWLARKEVEVPISSEDGAYIPVGVYLRTRYVSFGLVNVPMIVRYFARV